jgi:stearoyl-CoA desaturase (delta-9 desaturase)
MVNVALQPDESELDIPGDVPDSAPGSGTRRPRVEVVSPLNLAADRIFAAVVTFAPIAGAVLAVVLHIKQWYRIGAIEISLMLLMQFLSLVGVEVGFHRLFSHGAYNAHRLVRMSLAALGSMAFQGPVIWWAATHRKHHRYSDRPGDPHSPHLHGPGVWPALRQFMHSHIGWIWVPESMRPIGWSRYVMDLYRDPDILKINVNYFVWLFAGFAFPGVLGGLLHWSWKGALLGVLWGGFVRVFVMNHLTYWCINSVTHSRLGYRAYRTADHSSNVPLLAVPTLGQSWHNNHHAFPTSATMSHEWWQLDLGIWVIRALERVGLVWDVRTPSAQQMAKKKLPRAEATGGVTDEAH